MSPPELGSDAGDDPDVVVVLVTGPDATSLRELGRRVVEERLAACANVLEGVDSIYRWEGRVEETEEALAVLKTTGGRAGELQRRVLALHPYAEPEFLVLPVRDGSASYLGWVAASVRPGAS